VRGLAEYTPFARKSAVSKQTSGLPPEPAARRWKRLLCGVAARRASASPPENCDLVELLRASSLHAEPAREIECHAALGRGDCLTGSQLIPDASANCTSTWAKFNPAAREVRSRGLRSAGVTCMAVPGDSAASPSDGSPSKCSSPLSGGATNYGWKHSRV